MPLGTAGDQHRREQALQLVLAVRGGRADPGRAEPGRGVQGGPLALGMVAHQTLFIDHDGQVKTHRGKGVGQLRRPTRQHPQLMGIQVLDSSVRGNHRAQSPITSERAIELHHGGIERTREDGPQLGHTGRSQPPLAQGNRHQVTRARPSRCATSLKKIRTWAIGRLRTRRLCM